MRRSNPAYNVQLAAKMPAYPYSASVLLLVPTDEDLVSVAVASSILCFS